MELLVITPALAALPVTDISHVLKEINIDRKVQGAISKYYAKQRQYNRKAYLKRHY